MTIQCSALNPAIKRKIQRLETELDKKCYKLWDFTNPMHEKFLFGRFGKVDNDETIATVAVCNSYVCGGWEPIWD